VTDIKLLERRLIDKSFEEGDNWFYLRQPFLIWVEAQGPTHFIPRAIEQKWSRRVGTPEGIRDMLFSMYQWIFGTRTKNEEFLAWLNEVEYWYKH